MAPRSKHSSPALTLRGDQPRIGLVKDQAGTEVTRYYTEDLAGTVSDSDTQAALAAIGAWADLDWDEMLLALDQIRHETQPTPPFEP